MPDRMSGKIDAEGADKQPISPESTRRPEWLTPNLLGMSLASFLSDLGHEMATSVLPLFLLNLGASPINLGIIEGVSDGSSTLAKLVGGRLADRVRVRHLLASAGYLATGVSTGLFSVARSWSELLAARAVGWFSRGVRGPARNAMLADSTPKKDVGKAFGFHRSADTIGAVAGPLAAVLALKFLGLRGVFLLTALPGVLSGLCFFFTVRDPRARTDTSSRSLPRWGAAIPPTFRRFLLAVGLFGVGDFAHSLLVMRAATLLDQTAGAMTTAVFLYALHNVVHALMSFPIGALGDRLSRRRLLALAYIVNALAAVGFAFAPPRVGFLAVLFALAGAVMAAQETLEPAVAAQTIAPEARGTAFGILAAINGLGDLTSSLMVGLLWSKISAPIAFGYSAAMSLAGALMMAVSE